MNTFPSSWRDTPKNRERWVRLQNSYAFLHEQEDKDGSLRCHYCGLCPLRIIHWTDRQDVENQATVDHVYPLSRGGADHPSNMVVSCRRCNYAKGDRVLR